MKCQTWSLCILLTGSGARAVPDFVCQTAPIFSKSRQAVILWITSPSRQCDWVPRTGRTWIWSQTHSSEGPFEVKSNGWIRHIRKFKGPSRMPRHICWHDVRNPYKYFMFSNPLIYWSIAFLEVGATQVLIYCFFGSWLNWGTLRSSLLNAGGKSCRMWRTHVIRTATWPTLMAAQGQVHCDTQ